MKRPDTIHVSTLQRAGLAAGLLGSLLLPAATLLIVALWLAVRIASFFRSEIVTATVTDWQRDLDHRRPEEVLARPILTFTDSNKRTRSFVSSLTLHDAPAPEGGLLPSGDMQVRYRAFPFFAELDDPRLWFTLPALMGVLAVLGLLLNFFFRTPLLRLFDY